MLNRMHMMRALLLSICVLAIASHAAREPRSQGGLHALAEDRVALNTPYGRIVLKLLPENAPHTVAAVRRLARERGCTPAACNFYRAEARPNYDMDELPEGPPYALLQGTLALKFPASEGKMPVRCAPAPPRLPTPAVRGTQTPSASMLCP